MGAVIARNATPRDAPEIRSALGCVRRPVSTDVPATDAVRAHARRLNLDRPVGGVVLESAIGVEKRCNTLERAHVETRCEA